ncbi:unnamed protein product [Albugo candida]|uniref:Uncharacterized protein n=1 Tax=Albugo candida TaxID=65357 RepID=A0A024FY49_9STRA|nr:unnamed protein product [Albugo candida]|eukprot:CCI39242.1 unnamed protein product [Albugo candida]
MPLLSAERAETHQSKKIAVPMPDIRNQLIRRNRKMKHLVEAVLLKTLLHAIKRGSIEGIRVAIERGVLIDYVDGKSRNLIMFATKVDTDVRLQVIIILADAGCNINHLDAYGWNCLHHACACGALDVAHELVRRGVCIAHNPYGYGPEDFIVPKVSKASSLLQHTEQLTHEENVRSSWNYFHNECRSLGYALHADNRCDFRKPLKVSFQAPETHSLQDRIRIIDLSSKVPPWSQVLKTILVPPGSVGTITLDHETLSQESQFRILYERYDAEENNKEEKSSSSDLMITNLNTGNSCSMELVNEVAVANLDRIRPFRVPRQRKFANKAEDLEHIDEESFRTIAMELWGARFSSTSRLPDINSILKPYKIMAMVTVDVAHSTGSKSNEYEVVIQQVGKIGLHLEPVSEGFRRVTRLIVRHSSSQAVSVSPGDYLIGINSANIEHAGVKHAIWQLKEADRPLTLRFRRGNAEKRPSLFSIRTTSTNVPMTVIV